MTETLTTKRTRAYPSLWVGQLVVERLEGISGQLTDIVCTKALTETEAIKNFSAYYNHARRTNKTVVRTVRLYTFSEFVQERMCYDINKMPAIQGIPALHKDLQAESDRVAKLTCDQLLAELGIYHQNSPDAELPARPMAKETKPAKSIGSMLEHKAPATATATARQRVRPAPAPSAEAPAPKPQSKDVQAVSRKVIRRARG